MRYLFLCLLWATPALLSAQTLKELLSYAQQENNIVQAKAYQTQASHKEIDAARSRYFPNVDIGAVYKRNDAASPFGAGDTYNTYASLSLDIYDGGRRKARVDEKKASFNAKNFDKKAYIKSLSLEIARDFFNVKSLQASLNAREEAKRTLKAQLERIKSFYAVKMATLDDVERVQADYDTNLYNIQTITFQLLSLKSLLELKVGKKITTFDKSSFKKDVNADYETLDATKASQAQKNALVFSADVLKSAYYPSITLQDKYDYYKYDRLDPKLTQLNALPLDKQNTLLLTLNIKLFDYGEMRKNQEALRLNAQAVASQIIYKTKEQKIQFELAKARIATAKLKIKSAKSALNAAQSAFTTIEKKYNAGIVDYIVYLDALTKKTTSKALYESSLNDLEIAYATYYYYSGKNIQEELR